ncbi:hypothetical protein AVEN_169425-1, partial [Araneus ventricosus]
MWEKYKNAMANGIFHKLQGHKESIEYNDVIYNEALTKVEDQVISITGNDLSSVGMNRKRRKEEVPK